MPHELLPGGPSKDGSVTLWVDELKAGDVQALQPLWERYYTRLLELARARLRAVPGPAVVEDEQDAATDAIESFYQGIRRGRFPLLTDRDDLWRLLVTITVRKVYDQLERRRSRRPRSGVILHEAALADPHLGARETGLDGIPGDEPTPEFAAMLAEELGRRLASLADPALAQIAVWKMEGLTNEEIADRSGRVPRTVSNKLKLIRQIWEGSE